MTEQIILTIEMNEKRDQFAIQDYGSEFPFEEVIRIYKKLAKEYKIPFKQKSNSFQIYHDLEAFKRFVAINKISKEYILEIHDYDTYKKLDENNFL